MKFEKLKNICHEIKDGDWIESKDQTNSGIRLIQTGNIGEGQYYDKENRAKFIDEETFSKLKCTEIFKGDILISRLPNPVGRACIVPDIKSKMITAVDCTIVRVNKNICLPEYLVYYTKTDKYLRNINKFIAGTTRQRISRKNLEEVEINLLEMDGQKKAVSILNKVQEQIENRKKQIELLDDLIKSKFIELFGDLQKNPKKWTVKSFEEVFEIKSSSRVLKNEWKTEGEIPFYRVRDMVGLAENGVCNNEFFISNELYEELKEKKGVPQVGDIMVSATSTIGKCYIVKADERFYYKDADVLSFRKKIEIVPEYFVEFMKSTFVINQMKKTFGVTTVPHFTIVNAKKIKLLYPDIELQMEFANFLKQVDKLKFEMENSLKKLEDNFNSLMQKAFKGELFN